MNSNRGFHPSQLCHFERDLGPDISLHSLDHIAVQVYNASLSDTSPLLYPPGVYRDFMPRTKANLLRLTGINDIIFDFLALLLTTLT